MLYSSICQTAALAFVCTPYYDVSLLAADTELVCGESAEWWYGAAIAAAAIALFCVGLPLGLLLAVRVWRRGTARQQQRIGLLVHSYTPHAWYYESVDLLRKWALNSAVLWVLPNSKWQLVFGAFIAAGSMGLNLLVKPYRERVCGAAANAALFQLQATYIVALAFHEEDELSSSSLAVQAVRHFPPKRAPRPMQYAAVAAACDLPSHGLRSARWWSRCPSDTPSSRSTCCASRSLWRTSRTPR